MLKAVVHVYLPIKSPLRAYFYQGRASLEARAVRVDAPGAPPDLKKKERKNAKRERFLTKCAQTVTGSKLRTLLT
jgi:hypothetical protein